MRVHTGDKPHVCSICAQAFSQLGSLNRHLLVHSDDRPFQCEQCEKSFREKSKLKIHRNVHTEERPFFCDLCGKTYKFRSGLKWHMARHQTEAKKEVCSLSTGFSAVSSPKEGTVLYNVPTFLPPDKGHGFEIQRKYM